MTKRQVPWVSLLVEACISLLAITITSRQVSLQKMAIFGMLFSFFCTVIASFWAKDYDGSPLVSFFVRWASVCSTGGLASWTLYKIYGVGVSVPFILLFATGVTLALYAKFVKHVTS